MLKSDNKVSVKAQPGNFHYAWVIAIAGLLISGAGVGIVNSTLGVFVRPVCEELGFLRGQFTLYSSISTLVCVVLMPLFGTLFRRFGFRRVAVIGTMACGLVLIGYSFSSQLWHFYLFAFLSGLFVNGIGIMSVGILVDRCFDTNAKVIDVVNHPTFWKFGHLLFPLEDKALDPDMKLGEIDPLLYHYINIDVNTTVNVINYMLDEVSAGQTIFYSIHSEQDKDNFPKTRNTGLFYFRGKPGAPFAIVCPGGAFKYLGSIHESFPIALELSKRGYNAFALQYRTGGAAIACEDLACALTTVFGNAEMLDISTKGYSLWGSSAGARMVAYLGSYGTAPYGGKRLPKPGTVIMQYTSHTDYTEQDPPTFAAIGADDSIANCDVMEARINALKAAGIDTEFHKYPSLGHGFALGTGTAAEGWLDDAVQFWMKQIGKA